MVEEFNRRSKRIHRRRGGNSFAEKGWRLVGQDLPQATDREARRSELELAALHIQVEAASALWPTLIRAPSRLLFIRSFGKSH
jgi:hypothetical protein